MKAIDIDNKMEAEYINKVEMSGELKSPFEGVTNEQLKELIEREQDNKTS